MNKYYKNLIVKNKYLIAVGSDPVGLLAHIDTAVPYPTEADLHYEKDGNYIWSDVGLGADDRAGIYAIIDILTTTDFRPTIIFTTGEEKGGIGAKCLIQCRQLI